MNIWQAFNSFCIYLKSNNYLILSTRIYFYAMELHFLRLVHSYKYNNMVFINITITLTTTCLFSIKCVIFQENVWQIPWRDFEVIEFSFDYILIWINSHLIIFTFDWIFIWSNSHLITFSFVRIFSWLNSHFFEF